MTDDSRVCGVLVFLERSGGLLLDPNRSFQSGRGDVYVPSKLIHDFGLTEGAQVCGNVEQTERGIQLILVESVCGLPPKQFQSAHVSTNL